ncbi:MULTISPECIES: phosphatidylglycerol lysyltransferase domain-containing protein [Paenibacillus]|uniref:phosphatidylglycerol lysyltransferase domain-containing protein n=1 Tax=Paenibacillus TaxID=44249 RepID=UPI0022B8D58C|nr:phosphatidylglycerol lysyltransferase domain-containing protein [Paenibacillus caseinilyticus]MCZ8521441.1 phosphatidylglycerol lysyltransferase domain-containing protein [Paenibacillus caseinilyticus]
MQALHPVQSSTADHQRVDYREVRDFLDRHGGSTLSHLVLLQDKEIYWSSNKKALISFKKMGSHYFVLGDPIGDPDSLQGAVQEFKAYCARRGGKAVFYQVSPLYKRLYEEEGYRFFKLGEEAILDLESFDLAGKKGSKLRTRKSKFERSGFRFEVMLPPFSGSFLAKLEEVSASWLGKRQEKNYSVGFFTRDYVDAHPVAALYAPDGSMVAFATIGGGGSAKDRTVVIDLMRHTAASPHGTMDMLFLSIFFWAKEQGYAKCSLGMAPLAGVGILPNSTSGERVAKHMYEYGNAFYKFKGLREFKSKFHPEWVPKYLAYQGGMLPLLMLQLICLINFQRKLNPSLVFSLLYGKAKTSELQGQPKREQWEV